MGTEFNKEQYDAIYPKGIELHYWTIARNRVLRNALVRGAIKKNILEIGCGRGVVLEYLLEEGFEVNGVELASIPVKGNLEANIRTGLDVFEMEESECKAVETIMLLDVIEHIETPLDFLMGIKRKFPALKTIIVSVPACMELFSNYDEFNGHFRRYDKLTLLNEFRNMEYKKAEVSYFFHTLYFPAKLLLKIKGRRPQHIKAPDSFLQKAIHRILGVLFYWEFLLFPASMKGTSLLIKLDLK